MLQFNTRLLWAIYIVCLLMITCKNESVLIKWSLPSMQTDAKIKKFLVIYDPPVGKPPSKSYFDKTIRDVQLNDLLPATLYNIVCMVIFHDGNSLPVLNTTVISGPERPFINSVQPQTNGALVSVSYFDYDEEDSNRTAVSFLVLCSTKVDENRVRYINESQIIKFRTNGTTFLINGLQDNTWYELLIYSEFLGVLSKNPSRYEFRTPILDQRPNQLTVRPSVSRAFALKDVGPTITDISKEGSKIRVAWEDVDEMYCAEYRVEYGIANEPSRWTIFIVSGKTYGLINVIPNRTMKVRIGCIVEGAIVGKKAEREIDLSAPIISSVLLPDYISSTILVVTFSPTDVDQAVLDYYLITVCLGPTTNITVRKSKFDTKREIRLKNLNPGQSYKFILHTVYLNVTSSAVIANFVTYPLKVERIAAIIRVDAIKLMWKQRDSHLKNVACKVGYTSSDGSEHDVPTIENRDFHIFEDLKPDVWYTFSLTVIMNDQESESESITLATGPASSPTPRLVKSSHSTLSIIFRNDIFPETNGVLEIYFVILTEDHRLDNFSMDLPTWYDVQGYEIWPSYVATPPSYNPFSDKRHSESSFIVGQDTCHEKRIRKACNGPLKPLTQYYVKVHFGAPPINIYSGNQNNVFLTLDTMNTYKELENVRIQINLLKCGLDHSLPTLVRGPIGCGKTAIIQYVTDSVGRSSYPQLITIQLGEHIDSKSLVGTYQCSEVPGRFDWEPGPLTRAMTIGSWLFFEDLDNASADLISGLTPVLKERTIHLPDGSILKAHPDFRLLATLRSEQSKAVGTHEAVLTKDWFTVDINQLTVADMKEILLATFPPLGTIIDRILEIYQQVIQSKNLSGARQLCFRDLVKCFRRIAALQSANDQVTVFEELVDCFAAHIREGSDAAMELLGTSLNIAKEKVEYYRLIHKPLFEVKSGRLMIGRSTLNLAELNRPLKCRDFAHTRLSLSLLERLAVCVNMQEPVLLVGETGCGKTMTIQVLATYLGKVLHVVNLSQQSENTDLLGGYKPFDLLHNMKRFKERYLDLFCRSFSLTKNEKYLNHIKTAFEASSWDVLLELMLRTTRLVLSKCDASQSAVLPQWLRLYEDLRKLCQTFKLAKGGLLFSFVPGILTRAMKNGDWILLDEINLASSEALDCLNTILDNQARSTTSGFENVLESTIAHADFRLFACMNPSTDVGKRELMPALRNRFTEIFVNDLNNVEDLTIIVDEYLRGVPLSKDASKRADKILDIVRFYLAAKSAAVSRLKSDCWGHFPSYSLRTLCRALQYVKSNSNKSGNILRILYEGFCMSFLTELDSDSYQMMKQMISDHLLSKNINAVKAILTQPLEPPHTGQYTGVYGHWIENGQVQPFTDEKYILSSTVKRNLTDVARVVSARSFPVLLQGETSVGKTSLIKYLAQLTGRKYIRINNHEHTDVQEYVGSYVTKSDGKLAFVEGPLVQAMRSGYWIILDELNLAPPDVLEALNRVLDDNRELFITETQEIVKAHPNFMLFATQNPYGLYGGRKQLSRAFRNRFIELHFSELPFNELEYVLHMRCSLPPSYAKKMVKTMQDLQVYRNTTGLFAGRESYMTLRDLFRWGERYRLANLTETKNRTFFDWDQYLVDQGYLLLAGRCRRSDDHDTVCDVLQKCFGRQVDCKALFSPQSPYLRLSPGTFTTEFSHVVWTYNFRRMAVLMDQASVYGEPVLLVGDTGCGKTTLCQMLAKSSAKNLHTINCHMMTEAADFIGRISPAGVDKLNEGILFEWNDGPLVTSMKNGEPILIDEISLADDSVLERINSVLEPEKTLLLSELGDENVQQVIGKQGFTIVATMNPGGDYGKKELSRALRNRFTEIWCDSTYEENDIIAIVERSANSNIRSYFIDSSCSLGRLIFDFVAWIKNYSMDSSKIIVTIRDILSWVNFVNRSIEALDVKGSIIHGAFSTFLDGFGCSKNSVVTKNEREKMQNDAIRFLIRKVNEGIKGLPINYEDFQLGIEQLKRTDSGLFGIDPFYISCGSGSGDVQYCFESPTCLSNAYKILRAIKADKPILLEGSPGVGKSSLVMAISKAAGRPITRINLSEQTDLSDLFGTEMPVTLKNGQQGFSWVDGPLLSGIKNGHWILIDEMNLASQSVLEGLNACFDHRRQIFVPQLGRNFVIDSNKTQFFATQNPYNEGASRKGLPKSFLNRFTIVFANKLEPADMIIILKKAFPLLNDETIRKMVDFNTKLNEDVNERRLWGHTGGPWEFNLRDLLRWCYMTLELGVNLEDVINILYIDRMRTAVDRQQMIRCFEESFDLKYIQPYLDYAIDPSVFSIGTAVLDRKPRLDLNDCVDDCVSNVLLRSMLSPMRSLIHCIRSNNLVILVGEPGLGKSVVVENLAKICNQRLRSFYLTSDTDSSDLLGCFEQVVLGGCRKSRRKFMQGLLNLRLDLLQICCSQKKGDCVRALLEDYTRTDFSDETVFPFDETLNIVEQVAKEVDDQGINGRIKALLLDWNSCQTVGSNKNAEDQSIQFSWVDSPLVKALRDGDWLIVKNVHFCNPAVLDRLNALLEPGGELLMAEKGVVDGKSVSYLPHKDFRLIFTMHSGHSVSISRAMRNRGVEIFLSTENSWLSDRQDCYNVLKNKLNIDDTLFDCIWLGIESLKNEGLKIISSDLLKVGFVAKELSTKTSDGRKAVQAAFQIVFKKEFTLTDETKACYRPYASVSRICSQDDLFFMHKDTSFLQCMSQRFDGTMKLQLSLKHYTLCASSKDYFRRLKVCERLLQDCGSSVIGLVENMCRAYKQIEFVHKESGSSDNGLFDPRWSPGLERDHLSKLSLEDGNAVQLSWNRIFIYQLLSWIKIIDCSQKPENKSILFMACQALEGTIAKEHLPTNALLFLPGFFENLFLFFENYIKYTSEQVPNLTKILRGLFALKNLFGLCSKESTLSINDLWFRTSAEIKLLWKAFVKHFQDILMSSQVCSKIANEISSRWIADSQQSKDYEANLTALSICQPWSSEAEFLLAKKLYTWMMFLNKALKSAFSDNDYNLAQLIIVKRRQVCIEGPADDDPSIWYGSLSKCSTVDEADDDDEPCKAETNFVHLRRDIIADYLGFVCSLTALKSSLVDINAKSADTENVLKDGLKLSLQHDGQVLYDFKGNNDASSLSYSLRHFIKFSNSDSSVRELFADEALPLKITNLLDFPAINAVFMHYLNQNFLSTGQCNVPISMIDHFKTDLIYFNAFIWTIGPQLPMSRNDFIPTIKASIQRMTLRLERLGEMAHDVDDSVSVFIEFGRRICEQFTPPKNFMDPVEKAIFKSVQLNSEKADVEAELNLANLRYQEFTNQQLVRNDEFCVPGHFLHPYLQALLNIKQTVSAKLSQRSVGCFFRPCPNKFDSLVLELENFYLSVQSFLHSMMELEPDNEANEQLLFTARKIQNFLTSADHFVDNVARDKYLAFVDIVEPFLLGVDLLRLAYAQRLLVYLRRIKCSEVYENTGCTIEQISRNCTALMKCETMLIDENVVLKNFFSLEDNLKIIGLYGSTECKDWNHWFNVLFDAYSDWTLKNENDSRYFEYKPKESTVAEEQEECQLAELFPNFMALDDATKVNSGFLEEVSFAQLLKSLIELNTESCKRRDYFKTYQLASKIILPRLLCFGIEFDLENYDSCILAASKALESFTNDSQKDDSNEPFNVYKQGRLSESKKLKTVLDNLKTATEKLLNDWPDNAILAQIVKSCNKILNLPAHMPIIKLMTAVELLLDETSEWENVAAKSVKLEAFLQPIRALYVEWRKIEITGWEKLLDDVEREYEINALTSVMKFQLVLRSFRDGIIDKTTFLTAYTNLLTFCPLGEFETRIKATRVIMFILLKEDSSLRTYCFNLNMYFSCYLRKLVDQINTLRCPVEKELKEFIKIVKFQDLNVYRAKETGRHAHRQLLKFVRNYKEALHEPIAKFLNDVLPLPEDLKTISRNPDLPNNVTAPRASLNYQTDSIPLQELISYFSKYKHFSVIAASQIKTSHFRDNVEELVENVKEFSVALRMNIDYAGAKSENEKLYKRNKQKRMNLLIDLFESLRINGLRHREGFSLTNERLESAIFDCDYETAANITVDENLDRLFWVCIQRKNIFDQVAYQKPHDQIGTNILQRCTGYVKLMAKILAEGRQNLKKLQRKSAHWEKFTRAFEILEEDCPENLFMVQQKADQIIDYLLDLTGKIGQKLDLTIDLWRCNDTSLLRDSFKHDPIIDQAPSLTFLEHDSELFLNNVSTMLELRNSVTGLKQRCTSLKRASEQAMGFLSAKELNDVNNLCLEMSSLSGHFDGLVEISSTPNSSEGNLFNRNLIECKNLLEAFKSRQISIAIDATQATIKKTDDSSESLLRKLYFVVQEIFKVATKEHDQNQQASDHLISEIVKCNSIGKLLNSEQVATLCNEIVETSRTTSNGISKLVLDAFRHYSAIHNAFFEHCYSMNVDLCYLFLDIVEAWINLLKEGFVKPAPDVDSDEKSNSAGGDAKFEDLHDAGVGEGQGLQDVSEQIDDLGQVEGLKSDKPENPDDSEKQKAEDVEKPLEMDEDFDASMEDLELKDDDEKSDTDNEHDDTVEEPEWQAGEAENSEHDQLDPKMWDDMEENKESNIDDKSQGADALQEDLVAKNDNKTTESEENNEQSQSEENEEQAEPSDELPDLENVDLTETADQEQEDSDEISSMKGEEEQTDHEMNLDEQNIENDDENSAAEDDPHTVDNPAENSQSVQQAGGGSGSDQKMEPARSDDKLEENCVKEQPEKHDNRQNEFGNGNDEENDYANDTDDGKLSTKKRASPLDDATSAKRESHKRPKVDDKKKTLANSDKNPPKFDDEICEADADMLDVDESCASSTFSHRPMLNAAQNVRQTYDAASLDVAKKQALENQEQQSQMDIDSTDNVDRESSKVNNEGKKSLEKLKCGGDDLVPQTATCDDSYISDDKELLANFKPSTIHSALDFYNQASTSKIFDDFGFNLDNIEQNDADSEEQKQHNKILWSKFVAITQALASELSENLRLTLEPTLATKYQGDYRSGKRLNMRRLIPYIASYYRKNKIWLRRTKKAKRDYQIMLAIDDSSSMNDNKTKQLAFESLALVSSALKYLESGQLGVCKFGEEVQLLHSFYSQFDDDEGARTISNLKFEQKGTNIIPLMEFCASYFNQNSTASIASRNSDLPAQLLLIISDGRGIFAQGMEKVKSAVQKALNRRLFIVFIILDNPNNKDSIMDIKVPFFAKSGPPEIKSYLEFFPFAFYVILRRVNELPAVLGDALRQWFEMLSSQA